MMRNWLFSLLFVFISTLTFAQKASVQAGKYRMRIGEHVELNLQAQPLDGQKVIWPNFPDSLGPHFDIVLRDTIDTLELPEKAISITQKIVITSFDSGRHVLPVFDFGFLGKNGDTTSVITDALSIEVLTVPVDTTKAIKDIRGVLSVPPDYWQYLLYVAIVVALAILAWFVWRRYAKRKAPENPSKPAAPTVPAWEKALLMLQEIESEALWKVGKDKAYHSALTDVIKEYVAEQMRLPAPESTSDEILLMLLNAGIGSEPIEAIRRVFVLADLIKFAKGKALPAEHEQSLVLCRKFIALTRPATEAQPVGKEAADV